MKKIMLFAAACVALAACTKNIDTTTPEIGKATSFEKGQKVTFSVSAGDQTKATSSLDGTTGAVDFKWETGDKIKVTVGSESAEFTLKSGAGESTATFEGTMPGDGTTFNVQFPATTPDLSSQTYVEGQALPHNMMLATASGCTINDSFSLNAQNATLRLNLYGTGIKVTKIVVKQEGGSNTYTLDCGTGAAVGATSDAAKPFFVVVPASTFKFTAEVYDDSETPQLIASFTPSEAQTFSVGKSLNMPGKEVIDPSKYLCFTCTSGNVAIAMTKKNKIDEKDKTKNQYAPVISLQYYTDKTGWQDFKLGVGNGVEKNDSTSIALAPGEKVCFRAKTVNDSLAVNTGVYNYFTTTTTDEGKVDVCGNIMSLLNGDNPGTTLTHINTFVALFKDCTSIQSASGLSLPATTLTSSCYNSMFQNCTALKTAPTLPATTLAKQCYYSMFRGCIALETAPTLPATTLAKYCYYYMFSGCIALKTAPVLPVTTLVDYCYSFMFEKCTALETAPTLPATTLAIQCYVSMFQDCTALKTAPTLPATTLENNCYASMFSGCTALETAPVLPATTLKGRCYVNMFKGCIALETAPTLPATTLAEYCYNQIFSGCSKLSSVTMLATNISASNCLKEWLKDAGTEGSTHTLYVDSTMTTTITYYKGNFTVTAYSGN